MKKVELILVSLVLVFVIALSNCNNPFFGIGNTPDISPPVISVTSHTNNQVVSDTISLSGSIRDDIKIKKIEVYSVVTEGDRIVEKKLGDGTILHYENIWNFSLDTNTLEDGPSVIKMKTFDYANNEGVASISLVVDNYGPVVIINKPESGEGYYYYQEFQTAISCIDVTKTTLLEWQIVLDEFPDVKIEKTVTPSVPFEKDYKFNINPVLILREKSDFANGYGTLRIRAKNEKGKYSKVWYEKKLYFDFANSNPSILIIYPEETSSSLAKRVGKNITIMGQVIDNTGAKSVTIELTKPDYGRETFVCDLLEGGASPEKVKFFSYEIRNLSSGLHSIKAKAKDIDDLESQLTLDSYYFIVDTSFPTIAFSEPSAGSWLKGNIDIKGLIKIDSPDKIVKVEKKINNGGWTLFSNPNVARYDLLDTLNTQTLFPSGGEVSYYIKATSETDKTVEGGVLFNVDNFPPTGEILYPQVGNSGLNQTILIEGTAADLIASGGDPGVLKSVSLKIGSFGPFTPSGLSSWTYSFPSDQSPYNIGTTGNEQVDLEVTIEDNAGNKTTLPKRTLNINQLADVPTVTVTNLANGDKIFGLVTIQGTASDDDGIKKVEVKIDSGAWEDAIGGVQWAYKLFTSNYANGPHTLYYRSVDINNKTSEHMPGGVVKSVTFNIDPDSPIVTVDSHLNDQAVKGNITVTGGVTKTQGYVKTLQVKMGGVITQAYTDLTDIGGTVTGLTTKTVVFSLPINTTAKNGEFTVTFKAQDDMDRITELTRTLFADNQKPTGSFSTPSDNHLYTGKDELGIDINFNFTGVANDPLPSQGLTLENIKINLKNISDTYTVADGSTTKVTGAPASWSYSWAVPPGVKDGVYEAELIVNDRANNLADTVNITGIRLARYRPQASGFTINDTPISPNMYVIQNSTFKGTITDNNVNDQVAGVKKLELFLSTDNKIDGGDGAAIHTITYSGNNPSESFTFSYNFSAPKDYIIYRLTDKVGGITDIPLKVIIDSALPIQDFKYSSVGRYPTLQNSNPGYSASFWVKLDVKDTIDGITSAPMDGSTIRAKLGTTSGGDEILAENIYTVGDILKVDLKSITGNIYLWYKVRDKAGNEKTDTLTLTRDGTLPSLTFTQTDGVFLRDATMGIGGTATAGGDTINNVKLTNPLNQSGGINEWSYTNATGTGTWSYNIPYASLTDGDYSIYALVTCNDTTNWYERLNFTYDKTPPSSTLWVEEIVGTDEGRVVNNNISGKVVFKGVYSDNFGERYGTGDFTLTLKIDGEDRVVPNGNKTKNADGTFNWYYIWDSQTHTTFNRVKNGIAISVTSTDKAGNSATNNITGGNKNVVPYILSIDQEIGKIAPVIGYDGTSFRNLNDNKTYTFRLGGGNITIRGLNMDSSNNEVIYYNTTESTIPSPTNIWTIVAGNNNTLAFNLSTAGSGAAPTTTCYLYIKVAGTHTIDSNPKKIIMIRNYAATNYQSMGYMDMVVGDDGNAKVTYVKSYLGDAGSVSSSRSLYDNNLNRSGYGIFRFKESGENVFAPTGHTDVSDVLMHSHNIFWFLNLTKDMGSPSQADGKYYIFTCDSENVNNATWGSQLMGSSTFWYNSESGTSANLPYLYQGYYNSTVLAPTNDWPNLGPIPGPNTSWRSGGAASTAGYKNRWRVSAPNEPNTGWNMSSNEGGFPSSMVDWSVKWGDTVAKNDVLYATWYSEYDNKLYYRRFNNLTSSSTKSPATGAIVFNIKGMQPSITLDSANNPVIACFDETNGDLVVYYAQNSDPQNVSQFTKYTVDATGVVGAYPKILINGSNIHLAYQHISNATMIYAYTNNQASLTNITSKIVIDTDGAPGYFTDLQVTPNGKPVVTYIAWGYLGSGNAVKSARFIGSDTNYANAQNWEKLTLPSERAILASNPGGLPNKVRGYVTGTGNGYIFGFAKSDRPEFFKEK